MRYYHIIICIILPILKSSSFLIPEPSPHSVHRRYSQPDPLPDTTPTDVAGPVDTDTSVVQVVVVVPKPKKGIPPAAYAGIGVGAFLALLVSGFLTWCCIKKRQEGKLVKAAYENPERKPYEKVVVQGNRISYVAPGHERRVISKRHNRSGSTIPITRNIDGESGPGGNNNENSENDNIQSGTQDGTFGGPALASEREIQETVPGQLEEDTFNTYPYPTINQRYYQQEETRPLSYYNHRYSSSSSMSPPPPPPPLPLPPPPAATPQALPRAPELEAYPPRYSQHEYPPSQQQYQQTYSGASQPSHRYPQLPVSPPPAAPYHYRSPPPPPITSNYHVPQGQSTHNVVEEEGPAPVDVRTNRRKTGDYSSSWEYY